MIYSVVVTYNGAQWIEKCFRSLVNSTIKTKILAIDNASEDGTPALIKTLFPEVDVIETGKNLGFGRANNIGLKYALAADADYVFLLNQDAWIEPDTIKKLINFQKSNQQFGIVSPIHLNGNGDGLDKQFTNYINLKTIEKISESLERRIVYEETAFVNAASWLISKKCLNLTGGFDPIFYHYGEDMDYCNRAAFLGFKIAVLFNSQICHARFYYKSNSGKKERDLLFARALAHIKNPLYKMIHNYFSWSFSRIKYMLKYIVRFQYGYFFNEVNVIWKIIMGYKEIRRSNLFRYESKRPFLD